MTTPTNLPANPTIPLSPDLKAAYQNAYNTMQAQLDNSMDPVAVEALNAAQLQIQTVLDKNDLYVLQQDTALFTALQKQIGVANNSLKTLKAQIAATASHFSMAADIVTAIDQVLCLIPGA